MSDRVVLGFSGLLDVVVREVRVHINMGIDTNQRQY